MEDTLERGPIKPSVTKVMESCPFKISHLNFLHIHVHIVIGRYYTCKVSPANLLEGFGVSTVFVPQLSIMHIVDFNEI